MTRIQSVADRQTPVARSLIAAACAVAVLAAPTLAGAASGETSSVTVQYRRAALNDPDAARALYARIHSAARRACGNADMRVLQQARQILECRADAVARAVDQISAPGLGAVHRKATGEDSLRLASDR